MICYLDLDKLTPAVLNDMVKAVYVHTPDKSSGQREQRIDISYDLVGILPYVFTGKPAKRRNGIARKLRRFPKTILCCFMSAALIAPPLFCH